NLRQLLNGSERDMGFKYMAMNKLEDGSWKREVKIRNSKFEIRIFNISSLLFLFFFIIPFLSQAQEKKADVPKSKKIEVIDGRKYYLHSVEKGQTLYAISKVYSVSVNDIVIENPEAIDGISQGQLLRIPVV